MNFNPSTPEARGQEERYTFGFEAPMLHPGYAVQLRTRPNAVITPTAAHLLLPTVYGAPGIGIALVDTQQPAVTVQDFYPGTDTGSGITNFSDQSGATVNFGDVNDPHDDTDYARSNVAYTSNNGGQLYFRGNNAGALAGRRVLQVQIVGLFMNRRTVGATTSGNAVNTPIIGALVMGGNVHYGNWRYVHKVNSFQEIEVANWNLSPSTGIPWTVTEVDNIISASNADMFGFDWYGRSDNQGQRCSAYWLRVTHCAENRHGFYYKRGKLRRGWDRYALTSGTAVAAATWYWWEVNALNGSLTDFFTLAGVVPTLAPASDPADNTADHRASALVLTTGPGGAGQEGADKLLPSFNQGAVLLESSGPTINADSQPYGAVNRDTFVGAYLGVNFAYGQQITSAGAQPAGGYAGVTFPVGYWDVTQVPNRPLVVEVRTSITPGGGSLAATATLIPGWTTPEISDTFVKFTANWTPANNTQYFVHFKSDAVAMFGQNAWRLPVDDSRSDLVLSGSGTTVANVEDATQGGQTDSYFTGGVANDRYDIPVALTAPPTGPAGPTIDVFDAEPAGITTLPPRVRFTWPASALGSAFAKYRVWVRPHTIPARTPVLTAELGADDFNGLTATQAETLLREFWLYELGWSVTGGQYGEGWDIGISVVNNTNRLESAISWASLTQTDATSMSWVTSNAAPYLNTPLFVITREAPAEPLSRGTVFEDVAGRDFAILHVSGQVPGRRYKLHWASDADFPDESILAGPRAAYLAGRQMALLRCRGDRAIGGFETSPASDVEDVQLSASADFVTTSGDPAIAGPNMPAGYVLDGAAQRIDHADSSLLDPAAGAFTVLMYAVFPDVAGAYLSKDDGTTGYEFRHTTGALLFRVRSATGTLSVPDDGTAVDGFPHVVVGTSPGTGTGTKRVYVDGTLNSTGTTNHGTVSNADALNVGGDGAASFSALNPVHAYAYWPVELTAEQVLAASQYLLGHAGKRMPPGASLFVDLRDRRAYGEVGKLTDLSGNANDGTLVGSPLLRGTPWPLEILERKH